jgi:hypothetical protein
MIGEKQVYGIRGGLAHDAGSGSFVSWDNTKCNPLAPAREQARSAWEDGYASAKREWVGLTDDEIYDYADKFLYQHGSNYGIKSFGKAIEAKLKEKNT